MLLISNKNARMNITELIWVTEGKNVGAMLVLSF